MKKAHLFTIVCASALLPIASASAQSCGSGGRGYSSRGYAPSHGYAYSNSRSYGGSYSSRSNSNRGYSSSYRSQGSSCGSDRIRLIGGSQRGKGTRPSGWHDKRWFTSRGYKLGHYTHRHQRSGAVHGSSRSSRSSHSGHGH